MILNNLFKKEDITIVVTDSGLGGLSITADIVERLKRSVIFRSARIIFFNASFDNKSGYNVINDHQEKIRIFNSALESMASRYQPDLILIGCNTLSVVYPETPFSAKTQIPVVGIVKTGVDMILAMLKNTTDADVILFGTQTTISLESHKKALIAAGVPENSIYGIACGDLADLIEEGTNSPDTRKRISQKIAAALTARKNRNRPLIAALVCTHYGYAANIFKQELIKQGAQVTAIINPNPQMANFLFSTQYMHRHPQTNVTVEVICKVHIFPEIMGSITHLIKPISPMTVGAIRDYTREENLF